jgi:acetyl esterase/lipase
MPSRYTVEVSDLGGRSIVVDEAVRSLRVLYDQQRRLIEDLAGEREVLRDRLLANAERTELVRRRASELAEMLREAGEPVAAGLVVEEAEGNGHDWSSLSRTDAVFRVLGLAERPLDPGEIARRLQQHCRHDESRDVNATLAHLRRSGRAVRVAPAAWELPGPLGG